MEEAVIYVFGQEVYLTQAGAHIFKDGDQVPTEVVDREDLLTLKQFLVDLV